jgi:hypothetical protein
MTEPELPAELETITHRFPTHHELAQALRDGVNATIARLERERPQTGQREDLYPTARWMQSTAERLDDYARAFASGAATVRQYSEDVLLLAVGEQDGVPNETTLKIPDADGDIKIRAEVKTEREFDLGTLFASLAAMIIQDTRGTEPEQQPGESDEAYLESYEGWMAELLIQAMTDATGLAQYKPRVTDVRKLISQLARDGKDGLSAQVRGAIDERRKLKGVTMERDKR